MIVLFTTARTKDPQYRLDFLNVCCKPEGAVIPFTYKRRWVAKTIWDNHPKEHGSDALVVYAELPGTDATDIPHARTEQHLCYHPVRCAKIIASERHGPFLTLTLKLGLFADYGKISADDQFLAEFQEKVVARIDNPERNPVGNGCFVRSDPSDLLENEYRTSEDWIPLVEHLRLVNGLSDAVFCTTLPEDGSAIRPAPLLGKTYAKSGVASCKLASGESREIELHVAYGAKSEKPPPRVAVEPERVALMSRYPQQRAGGGHYRYRLILKRVFLETETLIAVSFPPDSHGHVQGPEFHANVTLEARRKLLILAVLMIAVGPLISGMEMDWIGSTDSQGKAVPPDTRHDVVLGIIRIAGAVLTGVGAWLGLTKVVPGADK